MLPPLVPFIANHDTDRAAGYLADANGRIRMAASLYILGPGAPFIYYGEEIGLRGSRGGANTDANRRLAMRWGDGDPVSDPPGADYGSQTEATVTSMMEQRSSLFHYYRRLIDLRNAHPEIARGTYTPLSFPDTKAGGFLCTWNGSTVGVFHNATGSAKKLDLSLIPDVSFSQMSFLSPLEEECTLEGTILTLGAQSSAVLW